MIDHFRTVATRCELRQKIERSEFLGIAFPAATDEAFFSALSQIGKRHFDATHHCWAFRLFDKGTLRSRSSDAGEPPGTAGRPILSAIEAAALLDTAVVVVRWFGGVKLGSGGLSRAYRDTAAKVLQTAQTVDRYVTERFTVVVPFDMLSVAHRLADPPAVVLAGQEFAERNEFRFDVRLSRAGELARALDERRLAYTRDPTPRLR
ncbi:MAG TPA: YigZ family protein [Thermoanaerobaculia bacterium]|nr:YigZ family protein [Thermoanaerobaculia bacterium]